jgi:NADH:ubiquinone oxidoreductase subunit K
MLTVFTIFQLIPLIILRGFILQQNHLLMSLLALEGVTLRLVLYVPLLLSIKIISLTATSVILLRFGACEARIGLALIVAISRYVGNDIIKSLSSNKC